MSVLRFNENAKVFSFLCHLDGLTFQAGQESRGVGRILQTVTLKWADTNCKVEASGTSRLEILQGQSNSGTPPRWNMLEGLFNVSPGLWTPTATCFGSPRGTGGCEKGRRTSGCLTRCGCWTTGTKDKWTDGRIQLRYEIKDKICRADGLYSDYETKENGEANSSAPVCVMEFSIQQAKGAAVCRPLVCLLVGSTLMWLLDSLNSLFLFVWRLSGHN